MSQYRDFFKRKYTRSNEDVHAAQTQKIAAHLAASEATKITLSTTPEQFDDIIECFETICQATKDCFQLIKINLELQAVQGVASLSVQQLL